MDIIDEFAAKQAKALRVENKMTQKEFAKILNKTTSFIANIENHLSNSKYNLKHLRILALHFNISPQYFIMPHHTII
jgi:transcriptional regulator with XRE-family HTH domain